MGNIEIQCRDCERVTEYDEDEFDEDELTCRECGGYFDELESDKERDIISDNPLTPKDISTHKFDPDAKSRFD